MAVSIAQAKIIDAVIEIHMRVYSAVTSSKGTIYGTEKATVIALFEDIFLPVLTDRAVISRAAI